MCVFFAGPNYTGAIVGAVVGGSLALAVFAIMAGLACWSWRTIAFRARMRLIEDQVYTIVIGGTIQRCICIDRVGQRRPGEKM